MSTCEHWTKTTKLLRFESLLKCAPAPSTVPPPAMVKLVAFWAKNTPPRGPALRPVEVRGQVKQQRQQQQHTDPQQHQQVMCTARTSANVNKLREARMRRHSFHFMDGGRHEE